MTTDPQVIGKIQKLLSLSESSNENEAAMAMSKARELLQKFNLQMSDVQGKTGETKGTEQRILFGKQVRTSWMIQLGSIIGEYFDCQPFFTRTSMIFIGVSSDAEIAAFAFEQAKTRIERLAYEATGRYTESFKEKHGVSPRQLTGQHHPKTWRNSWMTGFLVGLQKKLREEKSRQDSPKECTSLVLAKDAIVKSTVEELYPDRNSVHIPMTSSNSGGVLQGTSEGSEFDLWRGLPGHSGTRKELNG